MEYRSAHSQREYALIWQASTRFAHELVEGYLQDCNPLPNRMDCFTALYDRDLEYVPKPEDPLWQRTVRDVLETELARSMREKSVLSPYVSAAATPTLLQEAMKAYEKLKRAEQEQNDRRKQQLMAGYRQQVLRAAAQAEQAAESADRLRSFVKQQGDEDPTWLPLAFELQKDQRLLELARTILEWYTAEDARAGQIRRREVQRAVVPVGITTGREVEALLPQELMLMKHAPLLFARRYIEGQLLQYDRNFPVVVPSVTNLLVLVDESGSMADIMHTVKQLVWLIKERTEREGGSCCILRFSTQVEEVTDLEAFLSGFMSGGTDFDVALRAACDMQPYDRLLFLSDGIATVEESTLQQVRARFRELFAVGFGGAGAIPEITPHYLVI